METHLLEINLISAQGLKPPSSNLRRMETYAVAWVDPSNKLRTQLEKVGGENPTWNDRFIFRVTSDFLSCETSAVCVEIYAIGYLKDPLIGTVRFLLSNFLPSTSYADNTAVMRTPSFTALQIRRPSGRFHGVLNIGAMVINGTDFAGMSGMSAIGYQDLRGDSFRRRRRDRRRKAKKENQGRESSENSCGESTDFSDGGESTSSTSSVLKELNEDIKSDGAGYFCGLPFHRKVHSSPSDLNFRMVEETKI